MYAFANGYDLMREMCSSVESHTKMPKMETKEFCREIDREQPTWESLPQVWQSYVNNNLDRLPIKVMPAKEFNSMVHPVNSYWEEGDFIAHFCGHGGGQPGTNPLMEQFVEKHGFYF